MAGNKVYVQGNYVDIHDNKVVNLSIDKVGAVRVQGNVQSTGDIPDLPSELETPRAQELWQKLRLAGFVSEDSYMLTSGVSANQAAYIADRMADRLELKRGKWKIFQQLWGIRNMAQLAGSWQQTGKLPPRHKEIDAMI